MELRLRYYLLTNQNLEEVEHQFTTGQLLALRFASDEELIAMIRNPKTRGKAPEQIKREIILWKSDLMRV
jgi:hypothetical protein